MALLLTVITTVITSVIIRERRRRIEGDERAATIDQLDRLHARLDAIDARLAGCAPQA